jgi:hypothetical protein
MKEKICVLIITGFFVVTVSNIVYASQPRWEKTFKYTDPMVFELSGNIAFKGSITKDWKTLGFDIEPVFSAFIVKGFSIGGGPIFFFEYSSHPCECSSSTEIIKKPIGGGLQVFFSYTFDLQHAIFPYIAIGQGFTFAEELESDINQNSFFVGPDAGLKIVFRENGILNLFFRYHFNSTGYENLADREEKHDIMVGTGFGFWM